MPSPLDKYDQIFAAAGTEWNVDPAVLKAIAAQESGGDPGAVSKAGAQGLMGIIPSTQKYLGVTDPTDPTQSIYGGAKYLSEALTNENENPTAALSYYHGGPGWRGAYGPESQGYVPAVAAHYAQYAKANTGSMTDASPAAAPDYNNPPPAVAPQAPAPAPAPATPATPPDPYTAALTGANKPPPAAPADDPYTRAIGAPKAPAARSPDPALPSVSEYGDLGNAWWNKQANPPADAPSAIPSKQDLINWLSPDPKMIYGSPREGLGSTASNIVGGMLSPFARDPKTGYTHITLPPVVRSTLLGLVGTGPLEAMTWNPKTGTYGLTPEAQALLGFGAGRFGRPGGNPLEFVPPGSAERPPIPPGEAGNLLSPDAARKIAQTQGAPVTTVAPPTVPTPFNTTEAARPAGAPAGPSPGMGAPSAELQAALAPPSAAPQVTATGVPVKPPPAPPPSGAAAAASGVSEHADWLNALPGQLDELLKENAEVGGPSSLSAAATPPPAATMTASQARSYRTMAELNEIGSPIRGADYNVYTPGVEHTLAEREGNELISQKESLLRQKEPGRFAEVTQPANDTLVNTFKAKAGTPLNIDDINTRIKELDSVNQGRALDAAAGKTGNLAPVAQQLDDLLGDPLHHEVDAVRKVLVPLREAMNGADGELKSDPRAIWGMWKNVRNKIEDSKRDTGSERFVQGELVNLKKQLGDELNRVTDNKFQVLNDQHAELAKQKNAYEILQKKETTLTNKDGTINAASYHRWLTDLAFRRGRPGIDAAMDIPDATMRTLINIDNDLKLNGRIDLGKARGSPTNLYGEVAKALGLAGVHGLTAMAGMSHGGLGHIVVQQGLGYAGTRLGRFRLNRMVDQHLPPKGGWPNLLQPPP